MENCLAGWLSGLSASLWTKRLPVLLPRGTCLSCGPGLLLGASKRQPIYVSLYMFLSLSFPLLSPLSKKINEIFKTAENFHFDSQCWMKIKVD